MFPMNAGAAIALLATLAEVKGEKRPRPEPPRPYVPQARRNEPCPCNSGKKYKQCCIGKVTPAVEAPQGSQ